ncbi:MAG: hypothetical protein OHK0015_54730 [Chloroflexi bacterium OHK40]
MFGLVQLRGAVILHKGTAFVIVNTLCLLASSQVLLKLRSFNDFRLFFVLVKSSPPWPLCLP